MDSSQDTGDSVDSLSEKVLAEKVEVESELEPFLPAGMDELPEDPAEALGMALEALRETEQRADDAHQSHLRAVADLDNYRKRMRREQSTVASQAAGRTVASLLPVLDSFDAALGLEVSSEEEQSVLTGIKATYELMLGTLQSQGLEIIPTTDQSFSPDAHQPINAPPSGDGEMMVSNEVRRGYRLGGRLLRPALVVVTRKNQSE